MKALTSEVQLIARDLLSQYSSPMPAGLEEPATEAAGVGAPARRERDRPDARADWIVTNRRFPRSRAEYFALTFRPLLSSPRRRQGLRVN